MRSGGSGSGSVQMVRLWVQYHGTRSTAPIGRAILAPMHCTDLLLLLNVSMRVVIVLLMMLLMVTMD